MSSSHSQNYKTPKWIFASIAAYIILLFIHNDALALWEQDEAAYAGFAYTMCETGNYILPDFEWSWPHRKPPFHFWCIALSYHLFGYSEWATRLPSVMAILGCIVLLYYFIKKLYDAKLAIWSILVFMSSLLVPVYGKISMTDASLLFCFTGFYFSALLAIRTGEAKWFIFTFIFSSIGGLLKGPPIFITGIGACVITFIISGDKKTSFLLGLACLAGILPFGLWAYSTFAIDQGVFISWWFDWYILKRTTGTIYGQTGLIGYYAAIFLIGFFPWVLFIPRAIKIYVRELKTNPKSTEVIFQFAWLVSGWFVYEFIKSKLPSYAFAAIPVWCIYLAKAIVAYQNNKFEIAPILQRLLAFFIIFIGFGLVFFKSHLPFPELISTLYLLAGFFILFGLFYFLNYFYRFRLPYLALLFGWTLHFIAWGVAIPQFESIRSFPKKLAHTIMSYPCDEKFVFFSADYSMSSLPVYLSWNGWRYRTADRSDYEKYTADSLNQSNHSLFILQSRNFYSLSHTPDSFRIHPVHGWISDRGVVDTFYIAERLNPKKNYRRAISSE